MKGGLAYRDYRDKKNVKTDGQFESAKVALEQD